MDKTIQPKQIPARFFDEGYILGVTGPSQGTSRTDNVADTILKNASCDAIAEATNIMITVTELSYPSGKIYLAAASMDVKPLGNCQGVNYIAGSVQGPRIAFEFRNVNDGYLSEADWSFPIACGDPRFHFAQVRQLPDGGWLPLWAATSLRVDGGFSPCG